MVQHGLYGISAFTSGIGVAGAFLPVSQGYGGQDQLEVGMVAMLGVGQNLFERYFVKLDFNAFYFVAIQTSKEISMQLNFQDRSDIGQGPIN